MLPAGTISNTGKFVKMEDPDIFGENEGRSPHHSDLESWWFQVVAYNEDIDDQNGKPPTLPFPHISAYYC